MGVAFIISDYYFYNFRLKLTMQFAIGNSKKKKDST